MSRRTLMAVGLLVALIIAGVGSYYASSHPDGLEYVAEQAGFIDSADESATSSSPLADYQVEGVNNERLSGGLAGVIGCALVLVISGGVFWLVRRKGSDEPAPTDRASLADQPVSDGR
jgi:hypothetical protein